MPLTKLEHYLVLTRDIDVTRDFYVNVLGMQNGFRPPLGFPGHWVYIGDTPVIHIAEWVSYTARQKAKNAFVTSPAEGTGPVDHVAFGAEDYDGTLEHIRSHGVAVRENNNPGNRSAAEGIPRSASGATRGNIVRQLFLFDPNGVQIEINFRK
jgi:catechol 2,3-dioxygenase-like lactoylglutathione lyase family enzyme